MFGIKCRCCENNTEKRIVLERIPLQRLELLPDGRLVFVCKNIIKTKRVWKRRKGRGINIYKWTEENCRNNIIVKKIIRSN